MNQYILFCFQRIWNLINGHANQNCPTSCERVQYHMTALKLANNYSGSHNRTSLYAKYATPKIKIEKEYTIMGVNAIISATGGSLGLFLGLSCYGVAWSILERVGAASNYVLAWWRKKEVRGGVGSDC